MKTILLIDPPRNLDVDAFWAQEADRIADWAGANGVSLIRASTTDRYQRPGSLLALESRQPAGMSVTQDRPQADLPPAPAADKWDSLSRRGYMVLAIPDDEAFRAVLAGLRDAGLARRHLKCRLTAYNVNWPLENLMAELEREQTVTAAYISLRRLTLTLEQHLEEQGIEEASLVPAARKALKNARSLLGRYTEIETAEALVQAHSRLAEAFQLNP